MNDLDMDLSQFDPETLENMADVLRQMQKNQEEEQDEERDGEQ